MILAAKLVMFFKKPMGWFVGAVIVLALLFWGYRILTADARTEARLAKNQAEAASQSGSDAVNTVAGAADRESAGDALTRENEANIRTAPGAAEPVTPEAREAGITALCKRAAYKDDPRCKKD